MADLEVYDGAIGIDLGMSDANGIKFSTFTDSTCV